MKNKNKNKAIEWFALIIFSIIGVCMMIGSFYAYKDCERFKENARQTTATVIDVNRVKNNDDEIEYKVKYEYIVDGVEYESNRTTSAKKQKGQSEMVYYDRLNPEDMRTSTLNYSIFVFLTGLIFLVPVLFHIIPNINIVIKKNKLSEKGEKIIAHLSYVDMNTSITIQGGNPYYIVCKYVDEVTGQEREFKSEYFYFDPNPIIEQKNITTFPVYIDRKNPKKYYVSLEDLN